MIQEELKAKMKEEKHQKSHKLYYVQKEIEINKLEIKQLKYNLNTVKKIA